MWMCGRCAFGIEGPAAIKARHERIGTLIGDTEYDGTRHGVGLMA